MIIPKHAKSVTITFSDDICVSWPSWDESNAWDVWDSRHVRQGAHRVETVSRYADAEVSALALMRSRCNRTDCTIHVANS